MPAPTRRTLLGAGLASVSVAAGLTACDADAPAADTTPSPTPSGAVAPDSASPSASAAATAPTIPDFDETDWESVRAQFPLDPAMAQFAAFVLSPHTAQVDAAIDFHRGRLALDTEGTLLEGFDLENAVRRAAADHSGGTAGQYALTDSTTMGIASMYGGLALSADDEVLSTTHDFFSTEDSLRLLTQRTGAQVTRVTLYDQPWEANVDEMVSRLVAGLTRRTKVVAVTWVHSSTGVRLPIKEISEAIDGRALLCVDGVHGFAAVDVDLPDLGCDFLSAGTHKWLFGPRGTGILWGRDWDPLTELIPSFSGPDEGARLSPGGYHAFEHRWALDQGFAFHQKVGRAAAVQRTVEQASRLKEGLTGAQGIRVVTPADPEVSAGIVCLDVEGLPPGNGVYELRQRGIVASATPYQRSYLRLGPSIVTTPEQVDTAVEAVAGLV
ncbi:MAG TPA: aminotransferase class V-fold PLP-dependent enzyme [Nocardioides sp.]|nr:aminotransferase class V-fold PLP-dependent enzyme [Nocardioides sp.]